MNLTVLILGVLAIYMIIKVRSLSSRNKQIGEVMELMDHLDDAETFYRLADEKTASENAEFRNKVRCIKMFGDAYFSESDRFRGIIAEIQQRSCNRKQIRFTRHRLSYKILDTVPFRVRSSEHRHAPGKHISTEDRQIQTLRDILQRQVRTRIRRNIDLPFLQKPEHFRIARHRNEFHGDAFIREIALFLSNGCKDMSVGP